MPTKPAEDTPSVAATDLGISPLGLTPPATGSYKDNTLLYAAGDVVIWAGQPNNGSPPTAFEDPSSLGSGIYKCCGWTDVSGYIFKLDETIKDIPAAGVLTPVRSILTGGSKTVQAIFLEALNPYVRSLYDDVPIFPVASSPLKPSGVAAPGAPGLSTAASGGTILAGTYQAITTYTTASGESGPSPVGSQVTTGSTSTITCASPTAVGGATGWNLYVTAAGGSTFYKQNVSPLTIGTPNTITAPPTSTGAQPPAAGVFPATYIIPDPPADNRYSLIFDAIDGTKRQRLYAPFAKVTARGNDQYQQGDIVMTDLTFTLYPGTIGAVTNAVAQRTIDYGKSMTAYFT